MSTQNKMNPDDYSATGWEDIQEIPSPEPPVPLAAANGRAAPASQQLPNSVVLPTQPPPLAAAPSTRRVARRFPPMKRPMAIKRKQCSSLCLTSVFCADGHFRPIEIPSCYVDAPTIRTCLRLLPGKDWFEKLGVCNTTFLYALLGECAAGVAGCVSALNMAGSLLRCIHEHENDADEDYPGDIRKDFLEQLDVVEEQSARVLSALKDRVVDLLRVNEFLHAENERRWVMAFPYEHANDDSCRPRWLFCQFKGAELEKANAAVHAFGTFYRIHVEHLRGLWTAADELTRVTEEAKQCLQRTVGDPSVKYCKGVLAFYVSAQAILGSREPT